jgi:TRAP transporter TAXI family solute receptor
MYLTFKRFFGFVVLSALVWLQTFPVFAQTQLVTIASGGVTGVYYAAGGGICKLLNKDRAVNVRCAVEVSQGSVSNVVALRRGSSMFGLMQSDVQYNAVKGLESFAKDGASTQLRSVMSLYPEVVTMIVSGDTKATDFEALKGLRISRGIIGSGSRATLDDALVLSGMRLTDFAEVVERTADEQGYALCEKKIDGFGYTVGHPSPNVLRTIKSCGARLLPMPQSAIEKLVADKPYFIAAEVPAGTYPGQSSGIASAGLLATLVANESTPESLVYALVKAVFENLEEYKKSNPALANLQVPRMIKEGLTAPLHPGALRFYKEKGWL